MQVDRDAAEENHENYNEEQELPMTPELSDPVPVNLYEQHFKEAQPAPVVEQNDVMSEESSESDFAFGRRGSQVMGQIIERASAEKAEKEM